MGIFIGDADFDHTSSEGTLVLLANLGTPDAPRAGPVRRYLAEFLGDPRVIEVPRWLWMPILYGVILNIRPRRSARAYAEVWTEEGSPLLAIGKRQAAALEAELADRGVNVPVRLAMRYGNPSIANVLSEFRGQGLSRLVVLPLYPQYSGSTTGSTFDALSKELTQWRRVPDLSFIQGYHKTPGYISALAASVRQHWDANNRPDVLVMSFHGLPERYLHSGDPYFCHCHATARLLAEALELSDEQWRVSFQSRVGREVWLQPYTDELLVHLAQSGTRRVDVVCPGFAADCLETLEEIAMGEKERFENAGGELLSYIPALNDGAAHIATLADLVVPRLAVMEHANPQGVGSEMRGRRAKEKGASR